VPLEKRFETEQRLSSMELFGSYTSPYVRHCRIAMMQLGQSFTFVETNNDQSAKGSPTQRVPYLRDGNLLLTDSSSILQHVRQKAGQPFLADIVEAECFHLATTALSSTVNIFQLEKDKIAPAQSAYLQREAARVAAILERLNETHLDTAASPTPDSVLRVACFLGWALFRKRLDLAPYKSLLAFVERAQKIAHFQETAPPGA
jgi:glutathione S-transferase